MSFARVCLLGWLFTSVGLQALADEDTSPGPEYDVVVVGLGVAGVAALTRLSERGYKVLGLEAKDRIGGRVNTQEFGGGTVEFGAEWIHGSENQVTYRLARENNVTLIDSEWRMTWVNNAGYNNTLLSDLFEHMTNFYDQDHSEELNETVGTLMTKEFSTYISDKLVIAENLDFCKSFLRTLELSLASLDGFDSWKDESVRGAQDYEEYKGSQGWSWHRLGYTTLLDILLKKYNDGPGVSADIQLNHEVTEIDYSMPAGYHGVLVKAKHGEVTKTYKAKTALVTVSLGVLKHRHRKLFKPQLPEDKIDVIEALSIGTVDKICLHYEKPWWGDYNAYFFLWTDEEVSQMPESDRWVSYISSFSVPMSNPNVITMWITGAAARHMETLDLEVVRNKTEELLRRFFKEVPRAKDIRRSTWFSDPHVRGSYSYHGIWAESLHDKATTLSRTLTEGRKQQVLYFAGEASSRHHFGTVHGAIETGWREVDKISNHLLSAE